MSTSETRHVKEVEPEETATRTLSRTKNDVLLNSETEAVCLGKIKLRLDYLEISFDNILDAWTVTLFRYKMYRIYGGVAPFRGDSGGGA
jgi:hypothetical protein